MFGTQQVGASPLAVFQTFLDYRVIMNNKKRRTIKDSPMFNVGVDGFEPPTLCLYGRCSEPAELNALKISMRLICKYLWALTDSNRRPSACKADALNQLS